MKKILCVCAKGNIRSVAIARLLKSEHFDALACGVFAQEKDTLEMLCKWADHILIAQGDMSQYMPEAYKDKIIDMEIGEDIWGDAKNTELILKIKRTYYNKKAQLWKK